MTARSTEIKQEEMRLMSQFADRSLMFPGVSVLTWIRPPGTPWLLVGIACRDAGLMSG